MGEEVGEEVEVIDVETWAEETERVWLAMPVAAAGGIARVAHRQTLAEQRAAEHCLGELSSRERKRQPRRKRHLPKT